MAQLSHPNVVAVHDVGEHDDSVYVAMDFVKGQTLRAWLARERRSWKDVLAIFVQAGRGLAAAHEAGLVHRDFKPDNVLVDERGRALVTDFGLARADTTAADSSAASTGDARRERVLQSEVTREGALVGTPGYMAPEQFAGAEVDARTDQFALCVSLWEGLYGARPFAGTNVAALALAIGKGELPPPPRGTNVPRWVRRVVARGLAVDPAARWPTIDALLAALERGQARARMRMAMVALGLVVLAGLVAVGWRRAERARATAACEDAGGSIAAVWPGESRGEHVRTALFAAGGASGSTTADKLQPWLDAYAGAWRDARIETCLLHDVEAIWDDELAAQADECLEERRSDLSALVEELIRADRTVAQKAVTAAAGLAAIEPCTRREALTHRIPLPPDQREQVMRVRGGLSRATVLERAGRLEESAVVAESAVAEAESLAWPPLVAQAKVVQGGVLEDAGDYERSERALVDGYMIASKTGAAQTAMRAATQLIAVVGYRRARFDEALLWGGLAEIELGRLDLAEDDPAAADRLHHLALVHYAKGATKEAQALHEQVLAIRQAAFGPDHPEVANSLNNLAVVHYAAGDNAAAKVLFERSMAIFEQALGPDHPVIANGLNNLANLEYAAHAYAAAEALHLRAIAIKESAFGRDHPAVAMSLANLAAVHFDTGAYEKAKALLERAVAVLEPALGADHPDLATSMHNLGEVHLALGEHAQAVAPLERALAIRETALGSDDGDGKPVRELVESRFALAQALWDVGSDRRRALALAQRAATGARTLGADGREELAAIETWLAKHGE
jgi:tetratricopeptide (TPR) repeat protein